MTRDTMTEVLAIATVTGMRSMSGAAAMAARSRTLIRPGAVLLAAGEMVADKTARIGNRTDPAPLAARAIIAALLSARIAHRRHDSLWPGALLGAATAVASAYVAHQLRTRWPHANTATGLIEDAIVLAAATTYARRASA
jgi:uncharacterized membrane protein